MPGVILERDAGPRSQDARNSGLAGRIQDWLVGGRGSVRAGSLRAGVRWRKRQGMLEDGGTPRARKRERAPAHDWKRGARTGASLPARAFRLGLLPQLVDPGQGRKISHLLCLPGRIAMQFFSQNFRDARRCFDRR